MNSRATAVSPMATLAICTLMRCQQPLATKVSWKGCSLSTGIVSNAECLQVDVEHHSAPSGSRVCIPQMHIKIVDEGEDAPPSSPEVALQLLSGSSGSGLPAPDPNVTATWPCSCQVVAAMENAEAGPSKSTPVGEKRLCDREEGMLPPKCVCFQGLDIGSQVFDAHDPSQLLGMVTSIPTRPPPPPSTPSASEDRSLQEWVTAMEAHQVHLEAHISALEHNGQVFQVALFPGPPLGHAEAARDHEPTGKDGREDFGEWREEEEEEGWGLNDNECNSAESSDHGSYSEPEDAEWEDSENECDRALVVDEEEGNDSSLSVDSLEEEANALIAQYAPHDVAPSLV
ncbi:hypothetical protein NEOLEDRAFT_1182880 [Neolentinus lepideus HHB14362 ss-1]|uniref:Uncharacterized protein n=1 Tax=Neolentinus lepideus HHB14362 ss-1 TaxID=1314782 RepID=A0A165NSQ8_9AGAM|nr:hypothetical protein NEOLEDRAFT_1182880 [Neolentinus lepideus HHB14362 ss-1]